MFGRRNLQNTAALMKLLNLVIILFYCLITYVTTYRICRTFGAYGFLSDVGFIPQKPWHMPVFTLSAYALLYAAMNKRMNMRIPERSVWSGVWQRSCCVP